MKKLIFFLIPLNLFFDVITLTLFQAGSYLAMFRAVLYYGFVFILIIKNNKLDALTWFLLFYFVYIFIQIPFSTVPYESFRISLRVLISILMFPVGYYIIYSYERLRILNRSIIVTMVIFIINFLVSQYFGIGISEYTGGKEFLVGNLSDSWNNVTYLLLVIPLVLYTEKNKRTLILILTFILLIFLIIGLKRIAIFGAGFGYILYIILSGKSFRMILVSISFFLIFLVSLPLFEPILKERLYARGDRVQGEITEIISSEMRYIETLVVLEETISFNNPKKVILGLEAFNSVGNYANGYYGDRNLHIDYNLILNTTGILGLLLYLNIFYLIYKKKPKMMNIKNNEYLKILNTTFYMLLLTQFITSFGGQMYAITFRSIIFIYLGAIVANMKNIQSNTYNELKIEVITK